jgi:hypothetical protein
MTALESTIAGLQVVPSVALANLTMFPLLGGGSADPDYLTLGEAIGRGLARITEVSDHGSVPELRVSNVAELALLLLDGEELVGAKQNRIVNLSIMVAARSELVIPVSCVEAGRWHHVSHDFSAAERAHYSRGRAGKIAQVSASMAADGSRRSDQGAIWDEISDKAQRMRAYSRTSAAAALYEQNARPLGEFVEAMQPVTGQCGAAFAINGALAGLDLFDAAPTWAKQARKLVTSYALDAIDESVKDAPAASEAACRELLADVLRAGSRSFKAIGLGEDVRIEGAGVRGAALARDGRIVHLCAFRDRAASPQHTEDDSAPRIASYSRRRRFH